jgi:uncharacterized protein YggU (UPF0235/DUF167 family)
VRITVLVKPGAREEKVEKCKIASAADGGLATTCLVVRVKEPAKEGRANWGVERALAAHFNIASSLGRIISGQTSRKKSLKFFNSSIPLFVRIGV